MFDKFFDYVLDGIHDIKYFPVFILSWLFISFLLWYLSFFQQSWEFSASLINNAISILWISFISSILYLWTKGKQVEIGFTDLVEEIDFLLENENIDWFRKIQKSKFSYSKSFLKYESNPDISIGIYSGWNLFIGMNRNEGLINEFLKKNFSGKWKKTNEGYGVYCTDDINIINKKPSEIVDTMKKYTLLVKNTFK